MQNFVLLGGWTRREKSYRNFFERAPQGKKVYFLGVHSLDLEVFLPAFLKDRRLTKVNLIGHSLGGAVAIKFASMHPELVEKLYLVDSEGVFGNETWLQLSQNFIHTHLHSLRNLREDLKTFWNFLIRPGLYVKLALFAHKADLLGEAKEIKVPTVILWGEKDRMTPLWQGEKLNQLIPGSKLIVIPDRGHDWILHEPEKFWEAI